MATNPNGGDLKCAPGLWRLDKEDEHYTARVVTDDTKKGSLLAEIIGISYEEREHTGYMMAASKDLYVNLVNLVDCLETINAEVLSTPINLDHIREAKAALKKARGGN